MPSAGFFAVDYRSVLSACRRLTPNAAAAFVALAAFTRADNLSTTAGATALIERLGLSRGRAEVALLELERSGFISPAGAAYRRKLRTWRPTPCSGSTGTPSGRPACSNMSRTSSRR